LLQKALLFDNDNCPYGMIFGTNFLSKTGIKLDYDRGEMLWNDSMLSMHPRKGLTSADFDHMEDTYYIQYEDELLGQDWLEIYATEILDARYRWIDVQDVVDSQDHLNAKQKCDSLDVLTHIKNYFTVHWECIRTKWCTSKLNPTPNQCMRDPIPCLAFTCPCTNVNWTIL
jgi:hypothetical protein